jgi:small subunit ribosomal protein S21
MIYVEAALSITKPSCFKIVRDDWAPRKNVANKEFSGMQVLVRDNNVERALRVLKRKMQREGLFREMKRASFYEKPSERAAREKSEAVRRARKLARKQAIREGLIAAPVKKLDKKRPTRTLPSVASTSPKQP